MARRGIGRLLDKLCLTDVDGFYEHEKITLIMLIQSGKQPKNKGGSTPPTHLSTCRMIYQIHTILCLF